jgi:hypothetical protein
MTAVQSPGGTVVIGTGHTTSAPAAAVLNGTFIQGFEIERAVVGLDNLDNTDNLIDLLNDPIAGALD